MTLKRTKADVFREKTYTNAPCPPQIPHGLARDQAWASAVTGWQTAS